MRHKKRTQRLVREKGHRDNLLKNLAIGVFRKQRIKTTKRKAKEARRVAEKLITMAKKQSVSSRRNAFSILRDRGEVKYLFDTVAPLFKQRNGGYLRIIPYTNRKGDGAELVFLELVEPLPGIEKDKDKKKKSKSEKEKPAATEKEKSSEEAHAAPPPAHKPEKDKPKAEKDKKKKGFLKGIKKMFRGKADRG
jgi:large subunit ribosomal protein L17